MPCTLWQDNGIAQTFFEQIKIETLCQFHIHANYVVLNDCQLVSENKVID